MNNSTCSALTSSAADADAIADTSIEISESIL